MQLHRVLRLLPFAVLPLLAACGDDPDRAEADSSVDGADSDVDAGADVDAGPDADEGIGTVTYRLSPGAVLLEGDRLEGLATVERETTTLEFAAGSAALEAIEIDTVLVAGLSEVTPYGMLRRVVSITPDGDVVRVETLAAPLTGAFAALDVDVTLDSLPAELTWSADGSAQTRNKESGGQSFGGTIDWIVFDGDDDVSTDDDQVRVEGTIQASASYQFGLSYDLGPIDDILSLDLPPDLDLSEIDVEIGLGAEAEATVSLLLEGRAALGFEKEVELGRVYLPPVGAGPLVFLPVIRAVAGVEGSVPGSFQLGFGAEAGFSAGAHFSLQNGFESNFEPPYANALDSTSDVELGATARAYISVELDFLLYGIIGPSAGLSLYADAEANVFDEPCWRATAGLEATLGIYAELFSIELVDWKKAWPITDFELGSGTCETGEAVDPPPPISRGWVDSMALAYGADSSRITISRAIDGNALIAGTGGTELIKVDAQGNTIWQRRFLERGVLDLPVQMNAHQTRIDGGIDIAAYGGAYLRLDAAGHLQEALKLTTSEFGDPVPSAIITDRAGGVFVATTHSEGDGAPNDVALLHLDAAGNATAFSWGVTGAYEVPETLFWWNDQLWMLVSQSDYTQDNPSTAWILRMNADGTFVDATHITNCANDVTLRLRSALVTEDNRLVLGGYDEGGSYGALILSLDTNLDVIWASSHGAESLLGFDVTSLVQLESGALIVAGHRLYAAPDDVFVARTDVVGRFAWVQRMGGTSWESGPSLLLQNDGSAIVAAASESLGELVASLWMASFDVRDGVTSFAADSQMTSSADAFVARDICMATDVRTDLPATPRIVAMGSADVFEVEPEGVPVVLND